MCTQYIGGGAVDVSAYRFSIIIQFHSLPDKQPILYTSPVCPIIKSSYSRGGAVGVNDAKYFKTMENDYQNI